MATAGTSVTGEATPSAFALRVTITIICVYVALGVALIPFAASPGPQIPGFIALFVATILTTELSTAALLMVRFGDSGNWSVLLLACGYLYSGLMSVPQLLTFPGAVLTEQSLLAVSDQTAAWIFIVWINGFAAMTLIAVIVEALFPKHRIASTNVTKTIIIAFSAVSVAVIATSIAASWAVDHLPSLISGGSFTPQGWLVRWPAIAASLFALAIILFVVRERSHLYLWLSLALTAMLFHNILSGMGGARFTMGWTLGRVSWLASACALFVYFLWQFSQQQRLLTRTADLLELHAEGQIADLSRVISQPPSSIDAALQKFLARENVLRYNNMLAQSPLDEPHRQIISRLLAEEQAKLEILNPGAAKG